MTLSLEAAAKKVVELHRKMPAFGSPCPCQSCSIATSALALAEALRIIREHLEAQPSALAKAIVATVDNALAAFTTAQDTENGESE